MRNITGSLESLGCIVVAAGIVLLLVALGIYLMDPGGGRAEQAEVMERLELKGEQQDHLHRETMLQSYALGLAALTSEGGGLGGVLLGVFLGIPIGVCLTLGGLVIVVEMVARRA